MGDGCEGDGGGGWGMEGWLAPFLPPGTDTQSPRLWAGQEEHTSAFLRYAFPLCLGFYTSREECWLVDGLEPFECCTLGGVGESPWRWNLIHQLTQ